MDQQGGTITGTFGSGGQRTSSTRRHGTSHTQEDQEMDAATVEEMDVLARRVAGIRALYEERWEALAESVQQALERVQGDELIDTMRRDRTSQEFIALRAREIFEECLRTERESFLERLLTEHALLKDDMGRLEHRVGELDGELRHEREQRMIAEKEGTSAVRKMGELAANYEELMRRKDGQSVGRADRDRIEITGLRARLAEMESTAQTAERELEASLENSRRLAERLTHETATRNRLEEEFRTFTREIDALKNELGNNAGLVDSLEADNSEYKRLSEELATEVEALRGEKNALEEGMQDRMIEVERAMEDQSSAVEAQIGKLKEKYKEKLIVCKRKVIEYKERVAELNEELASSRAQGKKREEDEDFAAQQIKVIEEHYLQRMNEMNVQNEKNLNELQSQYQQLMDERLELMQSEAQRQIHQLKANEQELQGILAEKLELLDRGYIRLSVHNDALAEKERSIARLKGELSEKEDETAVREKEKETKQRREIETLKARLQGLERELKNTTERCQELEETRARGDAELVELRGKNRNLSVESRETLSEAERLKAELDRTKESLNRAEEHLRQEIRRAKGLKIEADEAVQERLLVERTRDESIRDLRSKLEDLTVQNRGLNEKVINVMRIETEKLENELAAHFETRSKLKTTEAELRAARDELDHKGTAGRRVINEIETLRSEKERLRVQLSKSYQLLNRIRNGELRQLKEELQYLRGFAAKAVQSLRLQSIRQIEDLPRQIQKWSQAKEVNQARSIASLEARYVDHIETAHKRQSTLESEYSGKFETYRELIKTLEGKNADITAQMSDARRREVHLREEIAELREEAAQSAQEIQRRGQALNEMTSKAEQEEYRTEVLRAQIREQKGRQLDARQLIERRVTEQARSLMESVEALRSRANKLSGDAIREANETGEFTRSDLNKVRERLSLARQEMTRMKEREVEASLREQKLLDKIRQLENELHHGRSQHKEQLQLFETELEEVRRRLREEVNRFGGDRSREVERLRAELTDKNTKIGTLISENARLSQQLFQSVGRSTGGEQQYYSSGSAINERRSSKTLMQSREMDHLQQLLNISKSSGVTRSSPKSINYDEPPPPSRVPASHLMTPLAALDRSGAKSPERGDYATGLRARLGTGTKLLYSNHK